MNDPEKVAGIDVGSNSCRLVISERSGAALLPYFNEKAMAGLGRGLRESGGLNPEGKTLALETFRRFRAILDGLSVTQVYAVATAAVREAKDGLEFRKACEDVLKVPLRVLSGIDEGRLSALGVEVGLDADEGLVADLGGSSLELQLVGAPLLDRTGETFLVGPLAHAHLVEEPLAKRRKAIAKDVQASALLKHKHKRLYAVGGAWRNVAAVHMMLSAYAPRVINGYMLDRAALRTVLEAVEIAKEDKSIRARLQAVAKKRYATLGHAALVLETLLEVSKAKAAVISAYGLRDGVVLEAAGEPAGDALLDTSCLYLKLSPDSIAFGRQLNVFVQPLLADLVARESLIEVTCQMADAGARMHPDHRAQLVFDHILRAPLPGLTHRDRVFAALAVATRYSFKFILPEVYQALLEETGQAQARTLGTAMRLGAVYSGRSASILEMATMIKDDDRLVLSVPKSHANMISATVERRLKQLAGLLQAKGLIHVEGTRS